MAWRKSGGSPRILCAGVAVLDEIFRVEEFPAPGQKVRALEFISVGGGCAANAATAVARLGGQASFAGPLGGPSGEDASGDVDSRRTGAGGHRLHGLRSGARGILGAIGDIRQCERRTHHRNPS